MNLNIASAVHDIKNKLHIISFCCENPTQDNLKKALRISIDASARLNGIVHIDNVRNGEFTVSKMAEDIVEFSMDAFEILKTYTSKRFTLIPPEGNRIVYLDRSIIMDSLINAVQNADRFAKGQIIFRVKIDQDSLNIEIRDDGDGFPSSIEACLEQGFGLVVSKLLLNHHGSDLNIFNDNGAVFQINIKI